MINLIKRLLVFSGRQKKSLIASFVFSLLASVFETLPVLAILTVLKEVLSASSGRMLSSSSIWISLSVMIVSIVGRILFSTLSCNKRTLGSFSMCTEKRLEIGERLKRVPMGYFSKNRPGEIAAAVTTTMGDIENHAVEILEQVAGGFIHAFVIGIWLLIYEWKIGLLMFVGLTASVLIYAAIQKAGKKLSAKRQAAQANLATEILEYIKGMGVIKAFGADTRSKKTVNKAIEDSANSNISLESTFSALGGIYQTVFKIVRTAILILAPYLLLCGEITTVKCLLLLVSGFVIYSNVELMGSISSVARVIEASMDRLDNLTDTPVLDENGSDISLSDYKIELDHVSFGYENKTVLHNVCADIPEKTSCAIVGPSGSGKSTLVSLVARFWDVWDGSITIGGHNVKEFTCDSLLRNFSIVFQNVYLFEDTIENNIRFGKPDASSTQVMDAAKKARCHEFIMKLPDGYQTKVFEGGASLSGGEKQRISIARAILKDAPIIILDEATASVDPENEQELQKAIAELTKDKTLLVIAHRLSAVRHADQIIVLDQGRIVQKGTHDELINQEGLYSRFVKIREQAVGWKLGGVYD